MLPVSAGNRPGNTPAAERLEEIDDGVEEHGEAQENDGHEEPVGDFEKKPAFRDCTARVTGETLEVALPVCYNDTYNRCIGAAVSEGQERMKICSFY